jgi:hypothetical protein
MARLAQMDTVVRAVAVDIEADQAEVVDLEALGDGSLEAGIHFHSSEAHLTSCWYCHLVVGLVVGMVLDSHLQRNHHLVGLPSD